MYTRQFRYPFLIAALLLAQSLQATQLGAIRPLSKIGEPLNAAIDIWLGARTERDVTSIEFSPDAAYRSNRALTAIAKQLQGRFESDSSGTRLRVFTQSPIVEPIVAFQVRIVTAELTIRRHYALSLQPPLQNRAQPTARRTRVRKPQRPLPIDAEQYRVVSGDSLFAIARRVKADPGESLNSIADKIFALNRDAFVGGDKNKLRAGVTLQIPRASAKVEAAMPTARSTSTNTALQAAKLQRRTEAAAEAEAELALELAALAKKYAALKSRYDDQKKRADHNRPTAKRVIPTPQPQEIAKADTAAIPPSPPPTAVLEVNPQPANDSRIAQGIDSGAQLTKTSPLRVLAIAGLLVALALLVWLVVKRLLAAQTKRREDTRKRVIELQRKTAIARKIALQSINDAANDETSVTTNYSNILGDSPSAIDFTIAHGRYAEAETMLRKRIAASPHDYATKLQLLEIYYMTEQIEPFCELAAELGGQYRDDLSDDQWRRIVRMGKIIAPERVPFSGPRMVSNSPRR